MTHTSSPVTAFIGGGNMATAIIAGLIRQDSQPQNIIVVEPSVAKASNLEKTFKIQTTQDMRKAINAADVVVLAVKPQVIQEVTIKIKAECMINGKVFLSIAAGTSIASLQKILGDKTAIVRLMPNMPALIGAGVTGFFVNTHTTSTQKKYAANIADSCGDSLEVNDEKDIDIVTALSGSGPAYFLLMMEGMLAAGKELGIEDDAALKLVTSSTIGAAKLLTKSNKSASELQQQIASKGGTTEAALNVLKNHHLRGASIEAVKAAYQRAIDLAE